MVDPKILKIENRPLGGLQEQTKAEYKYPSPGRKEGPDSYGGSMTKTELIEEVAKRSGLQKRKVATAVSAVFDSITEALKKGEKVALVGFGTFSVSKRKARRGRNPKTGAEIKIPARKSPKFSPGALLREAVK